MRHLLIHTFRCPDDGAFIRVKNLNSAIAEITDADCREIVLISLRHFREVFHNDQDFRIFEQRMLLPILWTNRHFLARIWNRISSWFAGIILALVFRPNFIVAETSGSWRVARAVKKWWPRSKLITDLHGAVPEEMLFHYPPSRKRDICIRQETELERDMVITSDYITCQSENMIEHLNEKHPQGRAQFHPFQCSVRSELFRFDQGLRTRYRRLLGLIRDETLFIYCGSFAKWQQIDYSVKIFAEYQKNFELAASFLILSPGMPDDVIAYARKLGVSEGKIRVMKVEHEEVSGYLNAADIGFLIREDCVVNRVASPTKLGEYLACGLPVIVGDVAKDWPAVRLDSSCFCFVNLENATDASKTINQFLSLKRGDKAYLKQCTMALAERTLSNAAEKEQLQGFIKKTVLEGIN